MKKYMVSVFIAALLVIGLNEYAYADGIFCGHSMGPCASSPVEGNFLFNSSTTGAANTAVVVTIAAGGAGVRTHIYGIDAYCSAGTSGITITDGGVTIFQTPAIEVTTTRDAISWPVGLTGATNSAVVITLASCGVGNTGTLSVQADRY